MVRRGYRAPREQRRQVDRRRARLDGIGPLADLRHALLIGGVALGLVALALYFHPFYLAAVLIDLAIVGLLWSRLATAS